MNRQIKPISERSNRGSNNIDLRKKKSIVMERKIKFKVIKDRGRVSLMSKIMNFPNFEIIPPKLFQGIILPEISVESQIIDYLDEMDKKEFMYQNDISIIIDYWVCVPKKNKISLLEAIKMSGVSEQMFFDLEAIYRKIKPTLKGKSIEKQAEMLFNCLDISYQSATNAYREIYKVLTTPYEDIPKKYKLQSKSKVMIEKNTQTK